MAASEAKDAAACLGFSEADQARIAIAVSELARNIVVHAQGRGKVVIKCITEPERAGIIVIAEDRGPGISDVEMAVQGHEATANGLGAGLGAVKRLMDEFEIETKPGEGTKITAKKWKDRVYSTCLGAWSCM